MESDSLSLPHISISWPLVFLIFPHIVIMTAGVKPLQMENEEQCIACLLSTEEENGDLKFCLFNECKNVKKISNYAHNGIYWCTYIYIYITLTDLNELATIEAGSQTSSQRATFSFSSKQYGTSILSFMRTGGNVIGRGSLHHLVILLLSLRTVYLFQITAASHCVWVKLYCARSLRIPSDYSCSPVLSHLLLQSCLIFSWRQIVSVSELFSWARTEEQQISWRRKTLWLSIDLGLSDKQRWQSSHTRTKQGPAVHFLL